MTVKQIIIDESSWDVVWWWTQFQWYRGIELNVGWYTIVYER